MQISLIIGAIHGGGAQRVVCLLANAWVQAGHNVTVFHYDRLADRFPFDQHTNLKIERLPLDLPVCNKFQAAIRIIKDAQKLRNRLIEQSPDAVVSFLPQTNVLSVLACLGTHIPIVITELCHPEYDRIGNIWPLLRKLTYRFADEVVVQTKDIRDWFLQNVPCRLSVIPNSVPQPPVRRVHEPSSTRKTIITAARLCFQKNLDSLLEAFASLSDTHPHWDLVIYGEGEDRPMLEKMIEKEGLTGRATLPGWTTSLSEQLANSHIFVLPSRFEGMPMALSDAMSIGLPCISTNCPSGPSELIMDGHNGFLVPVEDVDALKSAMDKLMSSPELRMRIGKEATFVTELFSQESALKRWQDCLQRAIERNR